MADQKFIYHMSRLSKIVPPKRTILEDISLSFFPGAKIGVVGPNGSGKSSLLRIMAGLDDDFQGEAWAMKGTSIGYLAQEPELDESLDVKGNVELAVKETTDVLKRFEEVNLKFGEVETDEEMNALLAEQAKLQDRIDASDAWNLDRKLEIAMDALRLPPGDADVSQLSGGERRRVALCRILLEAPDMLLAAIREGGHPATGRDPFDQNLPRRRQNPERLSGCAEGPRFGRSLRAHHPAAHRHDPPAHSGVSPLRPGRSMPVGSPIPE